ANGLRDVGDSGRVKRVRGSGLTGESEFLVRNIDADNVRAESARNHHRRQPDPAASMHRDPLAGSKPGLLRDAAKRRRKAAAERSGVDELHLIGKADEVNVGEWQGDIFGERAGTCETRLKLVFADLLVARETVNTGSTAERERGSHPVPGPPSPRVRTDSGDHAGELMAGYMRESPDVRVMPLPAVPVAPAQARGFHLNHHAVSREGRVRNNRYTRRGSKRIVKKRTHVRILIDPPSMAKGIPGASAFLKKTTTKRKSACSRGMTASA